jgi:hypothetical protein
MLAPGNRNDTVSRKVMSLGMGIRRGARNKRNRKTELSLNFAITESKNRMRWEVFRF